MKIGFTGTQQGMTEIQRKKVRDLIVTLWVSLDIEAHHGDCVGADAEFHSLVRSLESKVVIHPPYDERKRAFCEDYDEIRVPRPYLQRNHDIVNETEVLIATPNTMTEQQRSGTWATVRYARKKDRPIVIVFPDGTIEGSDIYGVYKTE